MEDAQGLAVSCNSAQAIEAYDRSIDQQLHAWSGALQSIEIALQHAPDFALAHGAKALILKAYGRNAEAQYESKIAQNLNKHITDREQSHVAIIELIVEGKGTSALEAVYTHAERWPTDAYIISTALGAFGLIAFSGKANHDQIRLDFIRKLALHYPPDHPWMLTHIGFGLIEANQPESGLEYIERSLATREKNGNAAHVLLHAYFELNRPQLGLNFVNKWGVQYPDDAMLFGHIHWHAALCELDLDASNDALKRLRTIIEPALNLAPSLVGLTDSTSLLWRLHLKGQLGLSWMNASQFANQRFPLGGNVFAEFHLAMLAAGIQSYDDLDTCNRRLENLIDTGNEAAPIAAQWAKGLMALLKNQPALAFEAISRCTFETQRLGGSHAQRTVIDRTLAWLNNNSL